MIILNDEQAEILSKLKSDYLSEHYQIYLLSGYAGTGKTTLTIEYIRFLNSLDKSVLVTAPTHKAVKVLRKAFGEDDGINHFSTLHSALALKEKILDSGERQFVMDIFLTSKMNEFDYMIIDEASMVDETLFNYIQNNVTTSRMKLLFIGDHYQIPPVGHIISPVFEKLVQQKYNFQIFNLNKIVRQAEDNDIIKLSIAIRKNITKNFSLFQTKAFDGKHIEYGTVYLLKELLNTYYLDEKYSENSDFVKVIAWTNRTVDEINHRIRKLLYQDLSKNKLVIGENLIADEPIKEHDSKWDIVFNNNSEMKVLNFKLANRVVSGYYLTYYLTTVLSLEDNRVYDIDILHESSQHLFDKLIEELAQNAMVAWDKRAAWRKYYNALSEFAMVKYAYCITSHKAQGSTYDNAIIIESDINLNRNVLERNKIKYTACTRSRDKLYIIN